MINKIFCFWFGPQMSGSRAGCLQTIKDNSRCDVVLINDENLKDFEDVNFPIHKGFKFLSATHKSDYLRSYFMYVHGGGYTDIKSCGYSWIPYFDELYNSDKQFISYQEINSGCVATRHDNSHIQNHWYELGGVCHFIFKEKTEFAKLWMELTNNKMDELYSELEKYPGDYHPRAVFGGIHDGSIHDDPIHTPEKYKYPVNWNELLGQILHNLMYENRGEFLLTMPGPNTFNYR